MGSFRSITYSFTQGIKNIGRNKLFSFASIATMSACVFLFGVLYFVFANVQNMILEAESNVGVTVFFDENLDNARITAIGDEIKAVEGVSYVQYLDAAKTWEQYKAKYLNKDLASSFGTDNPLENSMSYTVYFKDVSYESTAALEIAKISGVRKVNDSNAVVNTLTKINRALSIGTIIIVGLLLAIAVFLISTTISMGVSIRQREISIMHLIGATDFFIRGPFIIEGLLIGALGVCIPLSLLYAVYYKVIAILAQKFVGLFRSMSFISIEEIFSVVLPISLAMGIGIGVLVSSFTLSRQLKKIRSM